MNELDFNCVYALNFDEKWVSQEYQLALSVLKSGDFRDDSGLLIEIGDKTIVLTVDSNFIDFWRFPKNVDLLASSFAGGASGFPLCFETVNTENKKSLIIGDMLLFVLFHVSEPESPVIGLVLQIPISCISIIYSSGSEVIKESDPVVGDVVELALFKTIYIYITNKYIYINFQKYLL